MIPLIPILLSLASYAPSLVKYLGAGETTQKVAERVAVAATTITNTSTPEEALQALKGSSELQIKFREFVLENEQKLDEMYLKDVQDARKRDTAIQATGKRNWRAETMYVLAVIVIIAVFYAIWTTPHVQEFTKGVATLVLGRFLGYLDSIYNFEFGTTRTSRDKDATINKLSGS